MPATSVYFQTYHQRSPTDYLRQPVSAQQQLLARPESRKTLRRAKIASASLLSQRDTASSVRTSWTDNLSKMSLVFDFDNDVFSSGVYTRVFRELSKYRIRIHEERGWLMLKREEPPIGPLEGIEPNLASNGSVAASTHCSYVSAQEYQEPSTPPASPKPDPQLFQDHGEIVKIAETRMLEDCATFTVIIAKYMPRLQHKHQLPDNISTWPDIPTVRKFWKHQDFGTLLQNALTSGHYTTRQTGADPETFAQL